MVEGELLVHEGRYQDVVFGSISKYVFLYTTCISSSCSMNYLFVRSSFYLLNVLVTSICICSRSCNKVPITQCSVEALDWLAYMSGCATGRSIRVLFKPWYLAD